MSTTNYSWAFHDTSTECAICLEPLDDSDYDTTTETTTIKTNNSKMSATIRLVCGHRWRLQCLREQLELARPTFAKRLLLRHKVHGLLVEQLNNDAASLSYSDNDNSNKAKLSNGNNETNQSLLLAWKKVQTSKDPKTKEQVLREALKKYAFYLCSHCKEPYFGGTVECSDEMVEEESSSDTEPRLCMACTPQIVCHSPLEHLGSIVWKCRYCCQPATHVCYGNVHFCNHCHDRNTQRVQQIQVWKQEERLSRRRMGNSKGAKMEPPPPLEPIPCPGKDCTFPKPSLSSSSTGNDGNNNPAVGISNVSTSSSMAEFHSNGSSADCEQVYTCLICQSSDQEQPTRDAPGSDNLLTNTSGQLGLRGWKQLNPRCSWQVEPSDWPLNAETTTNFVSSFAPCLMSQLVDLRRLAAALLLSDHETEPPLFRTHDFAVEVSARYQARTDCPSLFRLEAIAMDQNQQPLQRLRTEALDAPPDHWDRAESVLEYFCLEEVQYVAIVILGKDKRF
ncbi:unnamed protein product [Cylindrotheca closterium]|uniref:FBA domain-containing protein n=1 Tax=Cylindrotheca closterium TaxID=2856 RepID=A0AAD2G379_9STRA|nr:unnamed protein product [Cylindrotheca closterium]